MQIVNAVENHLTNPNTVVTKHTNLALDALNWMGRNIYFFHILLLLEILQKEVATIILTDRKVGAILIGLTKMQLLYQSEYVVEI